MGETMTRRDYYAETMWAAEDVHNHREDRELSPWTDEQAEDWLEDNERSIRELAISSVWDYFWYVMED